MAPQRLKTANGERGICTAENLNLLLQHLKTGKVDSPIAIFIAATVLHQRRGPLRLSRTAYSVFAPTSAFRLPFRSLTGSFAFSALGGLGALSETA